MRPLPTTVLLRALGLLLLLVACSWGCTVDSSPREVSPYWNDRDSPVHIFASTPRQGFHLEMCPNGKVENSIFQSPYTALLMKAIGPGYISFIGAKSKLNLCMRKNGNLRGTASYNYGSCVFKQIRLENQYDLYESVKHKLLMSLGNPKRRYVPNMKPPRLSQFITRKNEIDINEIYPQEHQGEQ